MFMIIYKFSIKEFFIISLYSNEEKNIERVKYMWRLDFVNLFIKILIIKFCRFYESYKVDCYIIKEDKTKLCEILG